VPQYTEYRDAKALNLGLEQVVSDIRMAQSYASNTLKFGDSFPKGGYGIRFTKNSSSYVIFADNDGDRAYDSPGEKVEEVNLPDNVTVDSSVSFDNVDIVFVPPYGKIYADGASFTQVEIVISNTSGSTRSVKLKGSGSMEY
jgi:hypothetical protein